MAEEQLRLGGMALSNGVLVHGPNSWACAIRHPDGRLEVVSEFKRYRSAGVTNPLFRGPARLAEAIALLPQVRRRSPAARSASARLLRSWWPRSHRSRRLLLRCGAPSSPPTTAPSTSR